MPATIYDFQAEKDRIEQEHEQYLANWLAENIGDLPAIIIYVEKPSLMDRIKSLLTSLLRAGDVPQKGR
jgi:hypothetical protein